MGSGGTEFNSKGVEAFYYGAAPLQKLVQKKKRVNIKKKNVGPKGGEGL